MLKSLIQNSPVYPAARNAYRAVFKADDVAAAQRMGAFYAQFFQPGEIIFDVGANQGEYAECFAREGGRVIAIEPNEAHRARLEALAKFLPITPEYVAVSDEPGTATLNISSTSGYSTLASADSDWMAESPDYADAKWIGAAQVRTVTLDELAAKHGEPAFVKIDIEGYELSALKGMSFVPRYLSFEYGVRRKEIALSCLELLTARGCRFRPIDGRDFRFSAAEWMTGAEAVEWLGDRTLADGEYGDLFAHRWPT
jgi:FkbM family methyltransferase